MERNAILVGVGMLVAYLSANIYVFIRFLQALGTFLPSGKGVRTACKAFFAVFFWVAAVAMFVALFTREAGLPQWLQSGLFNAGSIWPVFILYMFMASLAVDLLRIFCCKSFLRRYGIPVAFLFVASLLLYGYINYRNPRVEEISIDLRTPGEELSGSGKQVRIVAVSDVHLGYATDKKDLQRFVEKINSLNPDIILIGGDLIDNSVVPVEEQRMHEELSMLKAPMGIYMVPGNHEYISSNRNLGKVKEFLARTPIVLLRDSVVSLPCGIILAGRDDRPQEKSMEQLMSEAVELGDSLHAGNFATMLLKHRPYGIAANDSLGFDIQFSGHTHRGQVWPLTMLVDRMYEQSHGYRKWQHSHVIVSSGLSLWGPPFRIGTCSDLWVLSCTR